MIDSLYVESNEINSLKDNEANTRSKFNNNSGGSGAPPDCIAFDDPIK